MLILTTIAAVLTWLILLLLLCNFGENSANALSSIHPAIYDIPWEICPVEFQKLVSFMLRSAQSSLHLKGFASINCSRALFKQVLQPICLTLKKLNFSHIWCLFQFCLDNQYWLFVLYGTSPFWIIRRMMILKWYERGMDEEVERRKAVEGVNTGQHNKKRHSKKESLLADCNTLDQKVIDIHVFLVILSLLYVTKRSFQICCYLCTKNSRIS